MIIWKLREVMDKQQITGKALAAKVGKHANTIYRLRDTDEMPCVDGKLLNNLCNALDCTLNDLVEFTSDREDPNLREHKAKTIANIAATTAVEIAQEFGLEDSSTTAHVAALITQAFLRSDLDGECATKRKLKQSNIDSIF